MGRTSIGTGIEEPIQNPSPEVTHILKRMGLAPEATIEHVRAAIQTPEIFAALGAIDLMILSVHFNGPIIEVGDAEAVTGSKLDGISDLVRDRVMRIQARAFLRSGMRRSATPRKTSLIEGLRASGSETTDKAHSDRKADLIARLQRLSEEN